MNTARRIAGALALLIAFGIAVGPAPLAASPLPRGEAFRVDATGDCQEQIPDVAPLPGGGFVAVWAGGFDPTDPEATAIYARVLRPDGSPAGPEIRVSERGRLLKSPAVAAGTDGRFLITWADLANGLRSRLFTAAGIPVAGEQTIAISSSIDGVDVAARPAGGYAVLFVNGDSVFLALVDANGDSTEGTFVESYASPIGFSSTAVDPEIAVQPDGDLVVAWTVQDLIFRGFSVPAAKLIPADAIYFQDNANWVTLDLNLNFDHWQTSVTVGTDALGNIVVAWLEHQGDRPDSPPAGLKAQIFDPRGQAVGAAFRADGGTWARLGSPRLLVGSGGDFVLAWHGALSATPAAASAPSSIYARTFTPDGTAAGDPVVLAPAAGHSREKPALAWLGAGAGGAGTAIAVWQEGRAGTPVAAQACFSAGISARRFVPGCVPGLGRLCLGDGRFQLSTLWSTPSATGQGRGQAVTRDAGYFWFFSPENVELMVKVLDGRPVNGKFWVFYGSLSNVAWTLRVADLQTGAEKVYSNPANRLASRGDTEALPGEAAATSGAFEVKAFDSFALDRDALAAPADELGAMPPVAPVADLAAVSVAAAPLSPVPPALLLSSERFAVEVIWRDPFNGGSGYGFGVPLTDDSGYFVFFHPSNIELVVKVLDGRAVNGKFWVFYGALTNIEYDLKVTHFSGAEKTYHNAPFQFRSFADTAAFTPGSCPCTPANAPVCGKDGVTYPNECEARCQGFVEVAHPGAC